MTSKQLFLLKAESSDNHINEYYMQNLSPKKSPAYLIWQAKVFILNIVSYSIYLWLWENVWI